MSPRRPAIARQALVVAVGVAFLMIGCRSIESVQPGEGRRIEIRKHTYEEIWRSALRVVDEHAELLKSDRERGVILAERTYHFMGDNGWMGIFITPTTPASESYTVEAVFRSKGYGQIQMQPWERKLLRDIEYTLKGVPLP